MSEPVKSREKQDFEAALCGMHWYYAHDPDFLLNEKQEYEATPVYDHFKVWEKARELYQAEAATLKADEATATEALKAMIQLLTAYRTDIFMTSGDCFTALLELVTPWPLSTPLPIFHKKESPSDQ